MSFTRTDSGPNVGAIIAVIAIHLLMFYAISTGLNVTKITQPLESMVTVFIPAEKPAQPPQPKVVEKIPDAKLQEVIPEPVIEAPPVETEEIAESAPSAVPESSVQPITSFSIQHRVDPQYPSASKRAGEQGTVLLELVVGPDGKTSEVSVLRSSGFPLLDQAAMDAVRKWRFNTHESGYARLQLPVTFKLENR